ncbi:MAG: NRDE family protein [Moheibacter sp.]
MCIVSIFSKDNGDFLLTHNRDESRLRPFSNQVHNSEYHQKKWIGPVDLVSGGTWIYYSLKYAACILNGGYVKHSHRPPYRMSRGLLILELLRYNSIDQFISVTDLEGIEPFTMMMLNMNSTEKKILVWNGSQRFVEDRSSEQLIVRSSTPLYTVQEKSVHYNSFEEIENPTPERVFELHDHLKMLPNHQFETVQTTSITQISHQHHQTDLKFCPIPI